MAGMDIVWHNHHIVPRHMGGTDDPSNIVKVNVPMHAFLHKCLWEEQGRWQDLYAWKILSGEVLNEAEYAFVRSEAGKLGSKRTNEQGKSGWQTGAAGRIGGKRSAASQLTKGVHSSQLGTGIHRPGGQAEAGKASQVARKARGEPAILNAHPFNYEERVRNAQKAVASALNKGTHVSQKTHKPWMAKVCAAAAASPNSVNKRKLHCIDHGIVGRYAPMKRWHRNCRLKEVKG